MFFKTIFILFCINSLVSCKDILVKIENGMIKGEVVEFNNKTIHVFRGIRYAKAPVGELRFKRPVKVDNWSDVYDAITEKNSCHQISIFGYGISKHISEDCLFLNVWAPHVNITKRVFKKSVRSKPVMVWIHGGALAIGSIWEDQYNAIALSATQDVIVVTVNYRLGPFGFLSSGTKDAPGNVGLYDQLLGLKWIKRNIAAFGGDPNEITIFGESAGSWSVSYHLLSPLSSGLFNKAILQSGSVYNEMVYRTKEQNLNESKLFARSLGCTSETEWISCLKKIQPEKLSNYTYNIVRFYDTTNFLPVVDEAFFPYKPYEAVKQGKFNSKVKILAGVTQDEGSVFTYHYFEYLKSNSSKQFKQNVMNFFDNEIKGWNYLESTDQRKKVLDYYLSNETKIDRIKTKAAHMFGDYFLVCPTYYLPKDIMLWSGDNTVYLYELTYKLRKSVKCIFSNESWMGVCHSEDIQFVFGEPLRLKDRHKDVKDQQFSLLVMNLWSNFAKTGDPMKGQFKDVNLPGLKISEIKWPAVKKMSLDEVESQVMNLNPDNFGLTLKSSMKSCEELWNSIYKLK